MFSLPALQSLSEDEVNFLSSLPKAELHAHLNGSIPLRCLQSMAKSRSGDKANQAIESGLQALENEVILAKITDFFTLFPAIYALTSNPENVSLATEAVLEDFLGSADGKPPQCTYLELRTTPRSTDAMSKREYLKAVLRAMNKYTPDQCNLIVSVDWRMSTEQAMETVDLALDLFQAGERIVGLDICGDFQVMVFQQLIERYSTCTRTPFLQIRFLLLNGRERLGCLLRYTSPRQALTLLTICPALMDYQAPFNPQEETDALLALQPSRLGHATFLDKASQKIVLSRGTPIELCLSSNLL
jgi:adenosine deaminase